LPIVEDNPYGQLWFDVPAPLAARWPEGTLSLGSFSKVLAPGLRWATSPKPLYPKLLQAKQAADLHTPGFNQRIVHEVIRDGFLRQHLPTVRALLPVTT
jgi:2-aminoadipate transaminase